VVELQSRLAVEVITRNCWRRLVLWIFQRLKVGYYWNNFNPKVSKIRIPSSKRLRKTSRLSIISTLMRHIYRISLLIALITSSLEIRGILILWIRMTLLKRWKMKLLLKQKIIVVFNDLWKTKRVNRTKISEVLTRMRELKNGSSRIRKLKKRSLNKKRVNVILKAS